MKHKKCIVVDHDIGTNPDDYFALILLLNSPEVDVALCVSGNNFPTERAQLARRVLDLCGRKDIPSYSGENGGIAAFFGHEYIDGKRDIAEPGYTQAVVRLFKDHEEIFWLGIQGLSNLAAFVREYPEYATRIHLVHMGLSITGYDMPITGGTNIAADPSAAKYVYEKVEHVKIVGSHTTINDKLRVTPGTPIYQKLEQSTEEVHVLLMRHLQEYHDRTGRWPAMHDPLTAAVLINESFVSFQSVEIAWTEAGMYQKGSGTLLQVSNVYVEEARFMQFLEERIG